MEETTLILNDIINSLDLTNKDYIILTEFISGTHNSDNKTEESLRKSLPKLRHAILEKIDNLHSEVNKIDIKLKIVSWRKSLPKLRHAILEKIDNLHSEVNKIDIKLKLEGEMK